MASEENPRAGSSGSPLTSGTDETALAREFVERVLHGVGLQAKARVTRDAAGIFVDLQLPDRMSPGGRPAPSMPAGRQGTILWAVQHLAHLVVQRAFPGVPPVYLAIAGQREQRSSQLRGKTAAVARLVLESGREMALGMVYQYEMRIVRDALKEFPSLCARAVDVGDELRRNVVIAPLGR